MRLRRRSRAKTTKRADVIDEIGEAYRVYVAACLAKPRDEAAVRVAQENIHAAVYGRGTVEYLAAMAHNRFLRAQRRLEEMKKEEN